MGINESLANQAPNIARLVHNTGFSLGANILARLAHVILFVIISRLSGPAEAGILTIGLTYLAITGRLATWGLDQILVRDVAQDLSLSSKYFANFVLIRIGLTLVVAILLAGGFLFFEPYQPESRWLIYLITLNILPEGVINLSQAVFMAYERLEFMTLSGVLIGVLKLLFGGLALISGFGIVGVVGGLLLANILAMLLTLIFTYHSFLSWQWELDVEFCRSQIKIAAPFVIIAGAYMIDNQMDVLLLSWQAEERQVGLYGAAVTMVVGIAFLPQAYRDAVFPRLAGAFAQGQAALQHLYRQSYKYLTLIALPTTLGLIFLARPILMTIFGSEFVPAVAALQILAVSVGLLFLGILHNRLLIIANQQKKIAYFLAVGLLLNLGLNLTLVPSWGISGAAMARLASNLLVFGLTYYAVFKQIYAFDAKSLWLRPIISSIFMIIVLLLGEGQPLWLQILSGAATYSLGLLLLKTFSSNEINFWLHILKFKDLKNRTENVK